MDMTVANTIRDQIGRPACMMIGAREFIGGEDYLQFRIGQNSKRVNMIKVTLTPADTYTVEFLWVWGHKVTKRAEYTDVYVDSLHTVIEEATGLYTHF